MTYITLTQAMERFGLRRTQVFASVENGDVATTILKKETLYSDHDLRVVARRIAKFEQQRAVPPPSIEAQHAALSARARVDHILAEKGRRLSGGTY
jgi:hypothetical protein